MKSTWKAAYGSTEIRIENSWFGKQKLFVNNELQDESANYYYPAQLTGT